MKSVSRHVIPVLFGVLAAATAANAQSADKPAAQPKAEARMHARPSADTIQRLQEGRLAMVKATLKLTDAQSKLFQPVEDLLKARQAQRAKFMQDRAANNPRPQTPPSLAERMERNSARLAKAAEDSKTFTAAFKPFYDSLSDEQKASAGPLFAEMTGGRRMHGHRFAGNRGMQQ